MAQTEEIYGSFRGGKFEIGTQSLSAATSEFSVHMKKILAALVTFEAAPGVDSRLVCDKVITTHKVTIARAGTSAYKYRALIIGF